MTPSIFNPAQTRCAWAQASPELQQYHDTEYGFPVVDNRAYFERLSLELFQAGLSWRTVLAKRSAFRNAFAAFSPKKVGSFNSNDIQRLKADTRIIRNTLKIEATIHNAQVFDRLARRKGGFKAFIETLPLDNRAATISIFKKTFKFMGPKIVEEFLMSTGHWPVRHEAGCFLAMPRISERAAS
jgi:DNA-3-methyladenine glycosylase I